MSMALQALVDRVAAGRWSVHAKLRAAFLFVAALLVGMAALCVGVLGHMADRVSELSAQQERVDLSRQMEYLVTAQSHYRTMALLTHDATNLDSIVQAKQAFRQHLDEVEALSSPDQKGFFARVREATDRFDLAGQQVLALEQAGQDAEALRLHLALEHPISHDLEAAMRSLEGIAERDMDASRATFASDQRLLTLLVGVFSVLGIAAALLLGLMLSRSFTLPLRRIQLALAGLASGQFDQHVSVANRDEIGALARDLNTTSGELAQMYGELQRLNASLQGTNLQLLARLQEQVEELARSRDEITAAEERLRRDIAEVLHSRVQNRLLLLWYRLEECEQLVEPDSAAARMLAEVREQIDRLREQDVRELSHRLHPSIIRAGLVPALELLAEDFAGRLDVAIDADPAVAELDDPASGAIPESVRLTAYRVVEEALGNVVRHAGASHVAVTLRTQPEAELAVEVRDDGHGFDRAQMHPGLGFGSMAARVGRIGGSWDVISSIGRGTTVQVLLPLMVRAPAVAGSPQG